MGFGSYDESEQNTEQFEDEDDAESIDTEENNHDGSVNYEMEASNTELIDRLQEIKGE